MEFYKSKFIYFTIVIVHLKLKFCHSLHFKRYFEEHTKQLMGPLTFTEKNNTAIM